MLDNNNEDKMECYFSFLQEEPNYFQLEDVERNNKTEKKEDDKNDLNKDYNIPKSEYLNKKTNREEKKPKKKSTEKEHKDKETGENSQENNFDMLNMNEEDDKVNIDQDYYDISNIEVNQSANSYKRSDFLREEFPAVEYKAMSLTEITKDRTKKNG